MKGYPSIPRSTGQAFFEIPDAYLFDKIDGRNLRVEWTKKAGWHKWGTRHRLFDATDAEFAPAIPLFEITYSEPLAKMATDSRWQRVTVYLEFWQEHSLGGYWQPGEEFHLTLFDIEPYKQCMLGPKEFLRVTKSIPTAKFLGQTNWTRGIVESVWNGQVEGVTFEGVVAKAGERHKLVKAKAKTKKWVDAILARHGEVEGRKLIES